MGKRVLASLMAMVLGGLSVGAFGIPAVSTASAAAAGTYYVSPWGNDASGQGTEDSPWRTIGHAVSGAAAGDTVKVMDDDDEATDDYVEEVTVDKTLTIARHDPAGPNPQVRSLERETPVFSVSADKVIIAGLDIYFGPEETGGGISLQSCHGCALEDNRIGWDPNHAIGTAIEIVGGGNNRVSGNVCSNFTLGIVLRASHFNSLHSNSLFQCHYSLGAAVIWLEDSTNNSIVGNFISQTLCPGITLWVGSDNNVIYLNRLSKNADFGYDTNQASSTWHSPEEVTYTYNSRTHTGYLGNYWDGYSGVDDGSNGRTAGDGVGDTELPYTGFSACDWYPLVDGSAAAYLLPGETPPPDPPAAAACTTYYVSPWGDDAAGQGTEDAPWRTIGHAVSRAAAGDTVKLMDDDNPSTDDYTENVVVQKSLTIARYNNSGPDPQLRGTPDNGDVFRLYADEMTIRGLEIQGYVYLFQSDRSIFEENRLDGMNIYYGADNHIRDNTFSGGLEIDFSCHNTISGNVFDFLPYYTGGSRIRVFGSAFNSFVGNSISEYSGHGIGLYGGAVNNLIYLNRFSGNPDGYIEDCSGGENSLSSPGQVAYTYNSIVHTGYLGNYYDNYRGSDDGSSGRTAGDGVGDTDLPYCSQVGDPEAWLVTDNYPLVDGSPGAYRLPGPDAPVTAPPDDDSPVQTQEGTITPVPPEEAATGTALVIKRLQPDGAPALTSRLLVRAASGSAASPGSLVCRFGGTFFTVEGADGPDGQASITAAYSDADLDAAGGDPDRLTLSYYDETRGEWVIVDTAVDTSFRTLTATSSHPGKWAVMAKPAPAANSSGFHLRYWALAGATALVLTIMVLVGFRHRLTPR